MTNLRTKKILQSAKTITLLQQIKKNENRDQSTKVLGRSSKKNSHLNREGQWGQFFNTLAIENNVTIVGKDKK